MGFGDTGGGDVGVGSEASGSQGMGGDVSGDSSSGSETAGYAGGYGMDAGIGQGAPGGLSSYGEAAKGEIESSGYGPGGANLAAPDAPAVTKPMSVLDTVKGYLGKFASLFGIASDLASFNFGPSSVKAVSDITGQRNPYSSVVNPTRDPFQAMAYSPEEVKAMEEAGRVRDEKTNRAMAVVGPAVNLVSGPLSPVTNAIARSAVYGGYASQDKYGNTVGVPGYSDINGPTGNPNPETGVQDQFSQSMVGQPAISSGNPNSLGSGFGGGYGGGAGSMSMEPAISGLPTTPEGELPYPTLEEIMRKDPRYKHLFESWPGPRQESGGGPYYQAPAIGSTQTRGAYQYR